VLVSLILVFTYIFVLSSMFNSPKIQIVTDRDNRCRRWQLRGASLKEEEMKSYVEKVMEEIKAAENMSSKVSTA